ncbi:hypothetical protein HAX54_030406 [Datura stramonium]|uniref:Gelsolin-like domain-containing protein n=1 Tax=Datura stramonium TaxID=4076 RepID=A0ABS8V9Z7_DATST|nr:hypothetical protein [Datura stramonium]
MSSSVKALDPAFQGAGQRVGLKFGELRISNQFLCQNPIMVNFTPVIHTSSCRQHRKGGAYLYDIHWLERILVRMKLELQLSKRVELDGPWRASKEEEFETRLYICKGKRVVRMKQVPFSRKGPKLSSGSVFEGKYHEGTCDVAIVDDGNLCLSLILTPPKLCSISDGQVSPVDGELSKSSLENNKCYLLDCGAEVFVWVGRVTQLEERKAAIQTAEEYLVSQNRPKATRVTRVIQGYETHSFKSNFDSWPSGSAPAPEEGRGKVAALLKQQGVTLKVPAKAPIVLRRTKSWLLDWQVQCAILLKEDLCWAGVYGKEPPQFVESSSPCWFLRC